MPRSSGSAAGIKSHPGGIGVRLPARPRRNPAPAPSAASIASMPAAISTPSGREATIIGPALSVWTRSTLAPRIASAGADCAKARPPAVRRSQPVRRGDERAGQAEQAQIADVTAPEPQIASQPEIPSAAGLALQPRSHRGGKAGAGRRRRSGRRAAHSMTRRCWLLPSPVVGRRTAWPRRDSSDWTRPLIVIVVVVVGVLGDRVGDGLHGRVAAGLVPH